MTTPPHESDGGLPISTTFDLPGFTVERTLGLSWGLIVYGAFRGVGAIKGLTAELRLRGASEIPQYTEVVNAARRTAVERLTAHTRELGGNAVLGVRFGSSDVGNRLAEIIAYGAAAVVRPA